MYRSVCPNEDVENWTEQIEAGTFPGVTFNTAEEDHHQNNRCSNNQD